MADEESDILTRKLFGVPVWVLGLAGLGGLLAVVSYQRNKAKTPATPATTGTQSSAQLSGVIPQFVNQVYDNNMPPNAGQAPPAQHVFNGQGQDLGEYRYGGDELNWIKQNIGQYGLTQSEYDDVVKAYTKVSQDKGADYANSLHYSWIGPGNVEGTPKMPLTADPNQGITITK